LKFESHSEHNICLFFKTLIRRTKKAHTNTAKSYKNLSCTQSYIYPQIRHPIHKITSNGSTFSINTPSHYINLNVDLFGKLYIFTGTWFNASFVF